MATPWNKTLNTSTDVTFDPSAFQDARSGMTLFFTASGDFWWSNAPITTFPVVAAAGTAGRPSKIQAGYWSFNLTESEGIMYFRADSGSPTLEGGVTSV